MKQTPKKPKLRSLRMASSSVVLSVAVITFSSIPCWSATSTEPTAQKAGQEQGMVEWFSKKLFGDQAARDQKAAAQRLQEEQVQREKIEAQRRQAELQQQLSVATVKQGEVLDEVARLTKVLKSVHNASTSLKAKWNSLQTNETGVLIARQEDLIRQAIELRDNRIPNLPPDDSFVRKIEDARRIAIAIEKSAGTATVPLPETLEALSKNLAWSEFVRRNVEDVAERCEAIVVDAKVRVLPDGENTVRRTLSKAMSELIASDARKKARIEAEEISLIQSNAIVESARIAVEIEREKKRKELADAQHQLDILKGGNQAAEAKAKADRIEAARREDEVRLKDEQNRAEAHRREELRLKASDSNVQRLLAPFITPGNWVPSLYIGAPYRGMQRYTTESRPVSFSTLQRMGIFDEGDGGWTGIGRLATIAVNPYDTTRPRWWAPIPGRRWRQHSEKVEQAKKAQSLLRELGPTLVEMGLLSQ